MEETECTSCNSITKSTRLGRAHYKCNKCGHNKFLRDMLLQEALDRQDPKIKEEIKETKEAFKHLI